MLVYVPGGEFTLGTGVHLSPFWIGKYPVPNEQYARFLEANPDQAKPEYWDDQAGNVWEWCRAEFREDAYKERDGQRDRGHGTHSLPKIWGKYLAELLAESEPRS